MGQFIYPQRIAYAAVDLAWLQGRACSRVELLPPVPWRFWFAPAHHIAVECLWRIVRGGSVIRTSEDHGHQFGLPAPVDAAQEAHDILSGATVSRVQLREATADIRLEFGGDLMLEIVPDSSGYESWQIYAPAGVRYVAQGGGQICTWTETSN